MHYLQIICLVIPWGQAQAPPYVVLVFLLHGVHAHVRSVEEAKTHYKVTPSAILPLPFALASFALSPFPDSVKGVPQTLLCSAKQKRLAYDP